MIGAATQAFNEIWSRAFRSVFIKTLGLTFLILVAIWIALQTVLGVFLVLPYVWLETTIAVLTGVGAFVGLAFLVAPISALVAGLFLDDVALVVEQSNYPTDPPGKPLPLAESIPNTIRFTALVIFVNFIALLLLLVPGVNIVAFLVANGYLLGREFFELAALRHMSREDMVELRNAKGFKIFLCGLIISGFLAIPFLNLLTPLFGTAFMVHVFKRMRSGQI